VVTAVFLYRVWIYLLLYTAEIKDYTPVKQQQQQHFIYPPEIIGYNMIKIQFSYCRRKTPNDKIKQHCEKTTQS